MFRSPTIIVGLFAVGASICFGQSGEPNSLSPQVVVLRNGNVLRGSIQNINRRLVISDGENRVTRVPSDDVDFVCADLHVAYRRKLTRIGSGTVEQHLQLARWCMRYDYPEGAIERLLYLNRVAPHHSAVKAFEKRLRRLASDGTSHAVRNVESTLADFDAPPVAKLNSPAAIGEFSRAIQPLLINRCGQNACHGDASKNEFRLTRGLRGTPNRQETQKNLLAVLSHIQGQTAQTSPLLLKARTIHGGAHTLPIEPHQRQQYARLYDWVKSVSDVQEAAAGGEPTASNERHIVPRTTARQVPAGDPFAHILNHPSGASAAAAARTTPAVDPFDPARFNSTLDEKPASPELPD